MKLWGWWKKDQIEEPKVYEAPPAKQQDPEATAALRKAAQPSIKEQLKHIGKDDFKNVNKIPCMRAAMLTGMGIGTTVGGVMYIARIPAAKAFNWAFCGFFVGSILSWEQCRFRRRQGKKNVVNARQQYSARERSSGERMASGEHEPKQSPENHKTR